MTGTTAPWGSLSRLITLLLPGTLSNPFKFVSAFEDPYSHMPGQKVALDARAQNQAVPPPLGINSGDVIIPPKPSRVSQSPAIGVNQSPPQRQVISVVAREVYNGGYVNADTVRLRIACGGAGQTGLIGAWANAFIKNMVEARKFEPFLIEWYLGDTTDSLGMLEAGVVDIAVTYNEAAEMRCLGSGSAKKRVPGFLDRFVLVGPKSNPAQLDREKDDVLTMFSKIAALGKLDASRPPVLRPPVRFLSRFDKSATNMKESEIFLKIGQVPWALEPSEWYHQCPLFPIEALRTAALREEYTLTDFATVLSVNSQERCIGEILEVYKEGQADSLDTTLLNPGHVLLGAKVREGNLEAAEAFLHWVTRFEGGRRVVREFKRDGVPVYGEPRHSRPGPGCDISPRL